MAIINVTNRLVAAMAKFKPQQGENLDYSGKVKLPADFSANIGIIVKHSTVYFILKQLKKGNSAQ